MNEICKQFGCIYAMKDGCSINGYTGKESKLTGESKHCPHYDVFCINAKCNYCCRENTEICPKNNLEVQDE